MNKLKRFGELPFQEKQLFIEALFFSFAAKLLLVMLPFTYCVKILSTKIHNLEKPDLEMLKQIKKAVHRTRWVIVWENQCLVTSIASRWMLQRRRIASLISLGVAFDGDKKLKAHAWISADDFDIVEKGGKYHELYYF